MRLQEQLNYIDWKTPENNVYHVTAEFSVERTRSHDTTRLDIVLFVNGIPFAVIERKSPNTDVTQAVSQMIRNQRDEYVPRCSPTPSWSSAQTRTTANTPPWAQWPKYWAVWREEREEKDGKGGTLRAVLDKPLSQDAKAGFWYELLVEGFGVHQPDPDYLVCRALTDLCTMPARASATYGAAIHRI